MADPIYLIKTDQQPVRMDPLPYEKEEHFQDLVKQFPELLAGEQIDREDPRRWLLVAREMGIPDREAAGARWSIDHFFVDQDGIPTLVEVKRQSDTRLRREVVGQVLEYAANASRFWPAAYLQQRFEKTCQGAHKDPDKVLNAFLAPRDSDPSTFWLSVEDKLRDGDIRLIFLADEVPNELQRIVEFLNSQMSKTEVLAVEVRRYVGEGFSTHVPRLLGQTAEAITSKAASRAGSRRTWDENSFFAAVARLGSTVEHAVRKVRAAAKQPGFDLRWGTGTANGSFNVVVPALCHRSVVTVQTNGILKPNFGWLPPNVQNSLAAFVRSQLDVTLPAGWEQTWPEIRAEVWTPSADALVAFLNSLNPGVTAGARGDDDLIAGSEWRSEGRLQGCDLDEVRSSGPRIPPEPKL